MTDVDGSSRSVSSSSGRKKTSRIGEGEPQRTERFSSWFLVDVDRCYVRLMRTAIENVTSGFEHDTNRDYRAFSIN